MEEEILQDKGAEPEAAVEPAGKKKPKRLLPAVVAVVVAILLCVSYFLPFTSLKDESLLTNSMLSDVELVSGTGITYADMGNPSYVRWAQVYKALSDSAEDLGLSSMNGYNEVFAILAASGVLALLSLLFSLLKKATPVVLLSLMNLGVLAFVTKYFEISGPVSDSALSTWAFGHTALLVLSVVLAVVGVWLFVAKHMQKKAKAE